MLSLRDAILAFECVKGLAPSYLSDKVATRSGVHSVNRDISLLPANARSSFEESICGSHCCAAIRTTKQSLSFKRNLKNHLVTNFLNTN